MILKQSESYNETITEYMKLANETGQLLETVPKLKNPLQGSYALTMDLDRLEFKYKLKLSPKLFNLVELRMLEDTLETRLVD